MSNPGFTPEQALLLTEWLSHEGHMPFTSMTIARLSFMACDWHRVSDYLENLVLKNVLKYANPSMNSEGHMRYEVVPATCPVTVINMAVYNDPGQVYCASPRNAVIAAYAQSLGDWNTWYYERRYGSMVRQSNLTVSCGDFSAFLDPKNEFGSPIADDGNPDENSRKYCVRTLGGRQYWLTRAQMEAL
jgi:hypothetical protein